MALFNVQAELRQTATKASVALSADHDKASGPPSGHLTMLQCGSRLQVWKLQVWKSVTSVEVSYKWPPLGASHLLVTFNPTRKTDRLSILQ